MSAIGPDHDRWADAAGAYVLDALERHEAEHYESHLVSCQACRAEVDELRSAAEALPASVRFEPPPPALKSRLMAEVNREAELLAAAGPEADRVAPAPAPSRRRRRQFAWPSLSRSLPAGLALAALLVGLVVGRVAWGGNETTPAPAPVPRASTQTFAANVDQKLVPGTTGRLVVRNGRAVLVLDGLPTPQRGRTYQVWILRPGGKPIPTSALFTPRADGEASAPVEAALRKGVQVLVSNEPVGGSPQPTTTPILSAQTS